MFALCFSFVVHFGNNYGILTTKTAVMKYPQSQFDSLVKCLQVLSNYIEIESINPSALHYQVYQNFSEGHEYNWMKIENGILYRSHNAPKTAKLLFPDKINFELYPEGCNDSHIETAVKKAIKQVKN